MKKILILLCSIPVFIAGCSDQKTSNVISEAPAKTTVSHNQVTLTQAQIDNGEVITASPEIREMHNVLKASGVIDIAPEDMLSISFPLGGYLKNIRLLPGMKIKKGSVLCTLEDIQYIQLQQDYLMAKSRLQFLESDFLRQEELNKEQVNSNKVFQQSRSEYESQKILVKSLSEKLRLININPDKLNEENITRTVNIISPIDGYISKVNVNTGKYISPTDILFELINPENIHLSITVFEKDAAKIVAGQRVTTYNNDNPSEKHAATIELITRNIDENRAAEVHCHFDRPEKKMMPGMFMNAEIEISNAKVPAIPDNGLVKWENKYYVFVLTGNNSFEMTPVDIGNSHDGFTEIKTDILEKQVVVKNAYALLMKLKNTE